MSQYSTRRRRILAEAGCDGVLVTNPVDVRYLTGLASSNAALFVTAKRSVLCTDQRYADAARELHSELEVVIARDVVPNVVTYAPTGAFIAFDSAHTSVAAETALREWPIWWEPRPQLTAGLRAVKDAGEIDVLRHACEITASAMTATFERVRAGMTERKIAGIFEAAIRDHGADGPSFPTIVATGPNSSRPHHAPGDREVSPGDLVLIDAGALLDGYHADMTRTAVLGVAAEWQRELHETVRVAQELGRLAMRAGADDVDARVQAFVLEHTGEPMAHGTGHGIGLEIHEAPILTATSPYTIPNQAAMTVEPGVYLPGRGGVRIEDSGLAGPDGYEVWTSAPYELLEIG